MIPVFEPTVGEAEIQAVVRSLRAGEISGTFGEALAQFESTFADFCGARYGVAVSSGTTALQLAVAAASIGPGDEVLLSSCTNIATALAVVHNGAVPVPVDSEYATWNLDLELLDDLITARTRAIIPVHLYGHPVDMDRLMQWAKARDLLVIEDAAEAHGATVRGRRVGALGDLGCFSFYANKIITTGEGGMVLTNDDKMADRLRLLRNLAFTEPRFRHAELGYNFRMTAYQAAMGNAQLDRIDDILDQKRRVADAYRTRLDGIRGLRFQEQAEWAESVHWMVAMRVDDDCNTERDELAEHLRKRGVDTRTVFCPMNQQPALLDRWPEVGRACPVADELWRSGLYLPSSTTLSEPEIDTVCDAILECTYGI